MRRKAEHMATRWRGLSDPSRLVILEALRSGGSTVSEVIRVTGLTQSKVSNYLGCLYRRGFVRGEQEGRLVRYNLSDHRVALLLRLSEELPADAARDVSA